MPAILFVCTGNLFRSPFAAALFRRRLEQEGQDDEWRVDSAGTWTIPGQPVPAALQGAAEARRVHLEKHRSKVVDASLLDDFDLILVMESGHKEALNVEFPSAIPRTFLISEVVDQIQYNIPDPTVYGQDVEQIASDMVNLIERGYPRICDLAVSLESGNVGSTVNGKTKTSATDLQGLE